MTSITPLKKPSTTNSYPLDRMLELHKKKVSLPPSAEREKIEREIAVTDEKIDDIVYGLYGVTEKRITPPDLPLPQGEEKRTSGWDITPS
jgi:hypothetical protein